MRTMPRFRLTKSQKNGVFLFGFLLILSELGIQLLQRQQPNTNTIAYSANELNQLQKQIDSLAQNKTVYSDYTNENKIQYQIFNPNNYKQSDWMAIGFSKKQVQTILNYKRSLGGMFQSKKQLQACYAISNEKFAEIEPYLLLPNKTSPKSYPKFKNPSKKKANSYANQFKAKSNYALQKFNPNLYKKNDWMNIGFSPKQAQTILNFRKSLGGEFANAEQLAQCYAISTEKFTEIKPYLLFQQTKKPKQEEEVLKTITPAKTKNINQASAKDIIPFVSKKKVAYTFVNYRKSLGGFQSKEQILKVYGIKPSEVDSIVKYFPLVN